MHNVGKLGLNNKENASKINIIEAKLNGKIISLNINMIKLFSELNVMQRKISPSKKIYAMSWKFLRGRDNWVKPYLFFMLIYFYVFLIDPLSKTLFFYIFNQLNT